MENLCGTRVYPNIDERKKNLMLAKLRESGATVTGNNPYDVDTHKHGVKLHGSWNGDRNEMTVQVTGKNFYVPCSKIWGTIDELIGQLNALQLQAEGAPLAASVCGSRTYPNIDQGKIDRMLLALRDNGATISGNNPWRVNVNQHGIVLGASWNEGSRELRVTVEEKNWYVPCGRIWKTIDDLMGTLTLGAARAASLCGRRSYGGYSQAKVDALIKAMRDSGWKVSGNNPYNIDSGMHGIQFRAAFDAEAGSISVEVTAKNWYVPCSRIWDALEDYLRHTGDLAADAVLIRASFHCDVLCHSQSPDWDFLVHDGRPGFRSAR